MKIRRYEEETEGGRVAVTEVETERGIGIARMPILDAEGEALRRRRIEDAFADLLRGCIRERGEAWVRERIGQ